jgi:hypothetical protein
VRRPFIAHLRLHGACSDAIAWADTQPSWAACWKNCERGDWMLWILARAGYLRAGEEKVFALTACACARLALQHTKDPRVLACIETTERWARGTATMEELLAARRGALAAAAAYTAAAYTAADAAAAAYAADAAAYAAAADAYAAYAAYAADAAAYAAAADAARRATLSRCAAIVREHFPTPPVIARRKVGAA